MIVKVCGLTRAEDVEVCLDCGFDLLGFIFHPKSPRAVIPEEVAGYPKGRALRVGVFVTQPVPEISRIMDLAGLDLAQLHGAYSPRDCRQLGPDRVIKALWPERSPDAAHFKEALNEFRPVCRYLLLDAGRQGGGHGRTISPGGLLGVPPPGPWLLAGGLNLTNIPEMADAYKPDGLDVNSGLEARPGLKDHRLLRRLSRFPELAKQYERSSLC